jgi:hypothetical protein
MAVLLHVGMQGVAGAGPGLLRRSPHVHTRHAYARGAPARAHAAPAAAAWHLKGSPAARRLAELLEAAAACLRAGQGDGSGEGAGLRVHKRGHSACMAAVPCWPAALSALQRKARCSALAWLPHWPDSCTGAPFRMHCLGRMALAAVAIAGMRRSQGGPFQARHEQRQALCSVQLHAPTPSGVGCVQLLSQPVAQGHAGSHQHRTSAQHSRLSVCCCGPSPGLHAVVGFRYGARADEDQVGLWCALCGHRMQDWRSSSRNTPQPDCMQPCAETPSPGRAERGSREAPQAPQCSPWSAA